MAQTRRFPANWPAIIARVEKWLAEAIDVSQQRESALASIAAENPPRLIGTNALTERTAALASCPARATEKFGQLDADLKMSEESLRRWLASAETTRRKLAEWVGRAVV
jgi:hypothetical protein